MVLNLSVLYLSKNKTDKQMDSIDLKKILKKAGVNTAEVAALLFPDNNFPTKALNRIMRGEGELTASQISSLAFYLDVPIGELFTLDQWKGSVTGPLITLKNGEYTATLDIQAGVTKIWQDGTLFHETVLHSNSITLSEYLADLNNLII